MIPITVYQRLFFLKRLWKCWWAQLMNRMWRSNLMVECKVLDLAVWLSTQHFTSSLFFAGLIYLPEIKYRRILNQAFGPGGWALMPRGETLHYQVLINRSVVWLYRSAYCYLILVKEDLQCIIPTEWGRGSSAHHKRVFSLLSRPIYIPGYWWTHVL